MKARSYYSYYDSDSNKLLDGTYIKLRWKIRMNNPESLIDYGVICDSGEKVACLGINASYHMDYSNTLFSWNVITKKEYELQKALHVIRGKKRQE